jgi:hypothetical protein
MSGFNFHTSDTLNGKPIGNSPSFPTVKTVNGKPVGDGCVTCDTPLKRGTWLCRNCLETIGSENINDTVNSMPDYLDDSQYEKWLKFKLLGYLK